MIKQTVKYEDFNGETQTEDLYFHLSVDEVIKLETSTDGGLTKVLPEAIEQGDLAKIMELFSKVISMAYGEKSEDNKRFVKDPQKARDFMGSPAYDALFMEITRNSEVMGQFITGIIPKQLAEKAASRNEALSSSQDSAEVSGDNDPPWIRENRKPTNRELISMDKDQLLEVMRRDRASQK